MEGEDKKLSLSLLSLVEQKVLLKGVFSFDKQDTQRTNFSSSRLPIFISHNVELDERAQADASSLLLSFRSISFQSTIFFLGEEYIVVSVGERSMYLRPISGTRIGLFLMKSKSEKFTCIGWQNPSCPPNKVMGEMMKACRNF